MDIATQVPRTASANVQFRCKSIAYTFEACRYGSNNHLPCSPWSIHSFPFLNCSPSDSSFCSFEPTFRRRIHVMAMTELSPLYHRPQATPQIQS